MERTGSALEGASYAIGRSERLIALGVAVVALVGMAYCHVRDVGMKFDEHVYYMGVLFCGNIAASLALIPAIIFATRRSPHLARTLWIAAAALAALTIAGFLWSRTIGFPQMDDHIGEWNGLGVASLVFEGLLLVVSLTMLARSRREAGGDGT